MLVAALAVQDLAEQAFLDHVKDRQLLTSVAAVFQKHTGHTRALIGLDELPALVHRICAAYLGRNVFSCVHRVDTDGNMCLPRGGRNDGIHLIHFQKVVVIGGNGRLGAAFGDDKLARIFDAVLVKITYADHVDVGHGVKHHFQKTVSAASESYEYDVDTLFHLVDSFAFIRLMSTGICPPSPIWYHKFMNL